MINEDVDVQVHERGSAAVATVTATFDMHNPGPDTQMLVGFPNFAFSAVPSGSEYDPVVFTPAHITSFRAWTDTTTFRPGVRKVSEGQYGGSDWLVWTMTYPRGKVTSVNISYEQALDTQHPESWYRPIVRVFYVLRTGAFWNGTIGKAHIVFNAPDGGGFVGSDPLTDQTSNRIEWNYTDLKPTFDLETAYIYARPWQELQEAESAVNRPDAGPADFLRAAQDGIQLIGTNGSYQLPRPVVARYAAATREWAWKGSEIDSADAWEAVGDVESFFAMPPRKNHGELACWPEAGAAAYEKAIERGSNTAYEKRAGLDSGREFGALVGGSTIPACGDD